MTDATFGTTINCIDGRTQRPVQEWMCREYGVDYVDSVTVPGADGVLSVPDRGASCREWVSISVNAHGSQVVSVVGHHDCAGNPVSEAEHRAQIRRSVETVSAWGFPVTVVGLWVNEQWQVEKIVEKKPPENGAETL